MEFERSQRLQKLPPYLFAALRKKMAAAREKGIKVMGLVDELDELDDVEKVFSNLNISDELFELYASKA